MPRRTIYGLSSGAGRAGVAVIRVSGPDCRVILSALAGGLVPPRVATLRSLRNADGMLLDRVLVLYFASPASFTGEDIVEFHTHGSIAVTRAVLDALSKLDHVAAAEPGEFTRRAFQNGKLDLLDVEALGDLLQAETELQRRQAMAGGSRLSQLAITWRSKLLAQRAMVEALIDFSDERDVPEEIDSATEQDIRALAFELQQALATLAQGERLRLGYRVAILGPPNAGKSTLLNAIAARDVAITSDRPGTTRDVVDVHLDLGGLAVTLSDTAGIRTTSEPIEQEGIRRSWGAAAQADLVLWLSSFDSPTEPPDPTFLKVHTKTDLASGAGTKTDGICISAETGFGLSTLIDDIRQRALQSVDLNTLPLISHQRQADAVARAVSALQRAGALVHSRLDLCAEELRAASFDLDRLIGRIEPEDVLGAIFSTFCIGK